MSLLQENIFCKFYLVNPENCQIPLKLLVNQVIYHLINYMKQLKSEPSADADGGKFTPYWVFKISHYIFLCVELCTMVLL